MGVDSLSVLHKGTSLSCIVTFRAMKVLYDCGLVVEPSGAAAFTALLCKKVPNIKENSDVVVFVTGSNITVEDLYKYIDKTT